ncbi:DNA (cytosine-5-)-methyltransferase [[Mycoplasma] anseris]|uniref:DNA (cytosine-5-)-methyltransferase n=1 Tax=[Mycoplasma] anseris TaxID=92400 RepID=A0A2Z4NCW6_9BACT|nr:DNA (cytosine-5-)-methyltransferase [[Mycoplasma] anseris]AWX69413.1 DNA (cytosine-5-)-methyltransferase [[Mycoplasma] anseris]
MSLKRRKLKIFEAFAGIGAQHKAISLLNQNSPINFEVVGVSDWDIKATIAYAAIHHNLHPNNVRRILDVNNITDVNSYLNDKVYSNDSKSSTNLQFKSKQLKEILTVADILNNNTSDIRNLSGKTIDDLEVHILTYSFPCQGLSLANMGRDKGIKDVSFTSHLIWEIARILKETSHKPKYLILENVKSLVQKYGIEYQEWLNQLDELGYRTFTGIFNGLEHSSLQRRERVFALSIRKEINVPFKDDNEFSNYVNQKGKPIPENLKEDEWLSIFDIKNNFNEEAKSVLINNTPSRLRMINQGIDLSDIELNRQRKFIINTLTTKQDRIPFLGYIKMKNHFKNKLPYRFITPREAYLVMGFSNKDFNKLIPFIKKGILDNNCLWRQAGNSILVNVLKSLFQTIIDIESNNQKEMKWLSEKK